MKRSTFRAWRCRQGVHRLKFGRCKDCHNDDQAFALIVSDVTLASFRAAFQRHAQALSDQIDRDVAQAVYDQLPSRDDVLFGCSDLLKALYAPEAVIPLTPALDS